MAADKDKSALGQEFDSELRHLLAQAKIEQAPDQDRHVLPRSAQMAVWPWQVAQVPAYTSDHSPDGS